MSKSYDNYIGLTDSSNDMYGKTLSIPDSLIHKYFEYATEVSFRRMSEIQNDLDKSISNPRDLKRELAREIVTIYYDEEIALKAEQEFDALFIKKDEPDEMLEYILSDSEKLIEVMVKNQLVSSNGEAKRMIKQGGVSIDREKINDINFVLKKGDQVILKVGKRNFLRIIR